MVQKKGHTQPRAMNCGKIYFAFENENAKNMFGYRIRLAYNEGEDHSQKEVPVLYSMTKFGNLSLGPVSEIAYEQIPRYKTQRIVKVLEEEEDDDDDEESSSSPIATWGKANNNINWGSEDENCYVIKKERLKFEYFKVNANSMGEGSKSFLSSGPMKQRILIERTPLKINDRNGEKVREPWSLDDKQPKSGVSVSTSQNPLNPPTTLIVQEDLPKEEFSHSNTAGVLSNDPLKDRKVKEEEKMSTKGEELLPPRTEKREMKSDCWNQQNPFLIRDQQIYFDYSASQTSSAIHNKSALAQQEKSNPHLNFLEFRRVED